jgi:hypothetical protein
MSNVVPIVPPAAHLIPEDQVTLQRLSDILDTTYMRTRDRRMRAISTSPKGVEIPLWGERLPRSRKHEEAPTPRTPRPALFARV